MVTLKNAAGIILNTRLPRDLAVSMVETGEAEVRYDPALLPLKSNADPGVIYLRR